MDQDLAAISSLAVSNSSPLPITIDLSPSTTYRNVDGSGNTVPIDAYRGAGKPEVNYMIERLIDAAARRHGFDPIALLQSISDGDQLRLGVGEAAGRQAVLRPQNRTVRNL